MTFIIILESIDYGQNLSITSEILNDYLKDPTMYVHCLSAQATGTQEPLHKQTASRLDGKADTFLV